MNLGIWSLLLTQIVNELTSNIVKSGHLPQYSLNRRLGGPKSRSRRFGEEKTLVPLPGIRTPTVNPYTTLLWPSSAGNAICVIL